MLDREVLIGRGIPIDRVLVGVILGRPEFSHFEVPVGLGKCRLGLPGFETFFDLKGVPDRSEEPLKTTGLLESKRDYRR